MKQTIRYNSFETNSSSTHALIIVDKIEFEKFKNGETYFNIGDDTFIVKKDIVKLDDFKCEYRDFEKFTEEELEDAIDEFIDNYCDCDYPVLGTYHSLDLCTENVYDKDGNEKVAFSYYING